MNKIYNRFNFELERIYEAAINYNLKLILSNKLKHRLTTFIDNKIAFNILKLANIGDDNFKITYIDIDDSNPKKKDIVSFMNSNKVIGNVAKKISTEIDWKNGISDNKLKYLKNYSYSINDEFFNKTNQLKNPKTTIGKLVNKLLPNKYNEKQIEEFVNLYKAAADEDGFEIVKGKDIQYWYDEINYVKGGGSLNKSCMRYSYKRNYMKFYAINPDKISMLILKDEDDNTKIKGRAILWKLDSPSGRTFMDRIYTVNDADVNTFINYATKNQWLYKERQSIFCDNDYVDTLIKKTIHTPLIINNLNDPGDGNYPYMDTLCYFDGSTISDNIHECNNTSNIKDLTQLDGGHFSANSSNWSNYYQKYLNNANVVNVWLDENCENSDMRIESDDTYWQWVIDGSYYDNNVPKEKVYFINGWVWSDYDKKFLKKNNAVKVFTNMDKTKTDWRKIKYGFSYWKWEKKDGGDDNYYCDEFDATDLSKYNNKVWSEYEEKYFYPSEVTRVYTVADQTETDWRVNDDNTYWCLDTKDGEVCYCDNVSGDEIEEYLGIEDLNEYTENN